MIVTLGNVSYHQACDGKTTGSSVSPTDSATHTYVLAIAPAGQESSTLRYSVAAGPTR